MAPPDSSSGLSTTQTLSSTDDFLGDGAQAIIAVNQKLKQLGIDQTISLPQLCVIGDQSAGKSSLIEAISHIQVPKADGTCTRCPVAINLGSGTSAESPWTCQIFIEERYDYIPGKPVTADNPLGPWQKRIDMKTIDLGTINDKSQVPKLISEAQSQILDVADDANITTRSRTTLAVKFSPNVIRLDITEGIRPNFCFIDLPGVISNVARREDQYLIQLVANLVKEYAKDPRNENILTLPMTADVQNSNTCSIVQELQVEERTLAVFTKPDRVKEDQQNNFISQYLTKSIANGEIENDEVLRFQSGCHFVMLANSSGESLAASNAEAEFFKQPVWATLDENFRQRLGVPALCDYLREQLFHKTYEALPENLQAIEDELANIEKSLKLLPQPPDKTKFRIEMQQILQEFANRMADKFLGDREDSIKGALREKFKEFQNWVNKAMPVIDYASRSEMREMQNMREGIKEILKDKKNAKEQDSPDWEVEETSGKRFRLTYLRNINRQFYHSGLQEADPRALEKANKEALECWHGLLNQFMHEVRVLFQKNAMEVFDRVFKPYQNLGIHPMVKAWIEDYLKKAMDSEHHIADMNSLAERSMPFTLEILSSRNKVREKALADQRLDFRLDLAKKVRNVEEGTFRRDRKDVNKDTIEDDEFASEIILGSKVQAYYETASKRFVDVICQGIFSRMLPVFGEELAAGLKAHIEPSDAKNEDQITQWLVEDPEKENSRRRLTNKRQQLREGRLYIESVLGGTTGTGTSTSPSEQEFSPVSNGAALPNSTSNNGSPSKRGPSPALNGAALPETRAKKPKMADRPGSAEPTTPRSQMTKKFEDFEMIS